MNTISSRTTTLGMSSLRPHLSLDRLGSVIAVLIGVALFASPFVIYRANRIVAGEGRMLTAALPPAGALGIIAVGVGVALCAALVRNPLPRLAAAILGLVTVFPAVGWSAGFVTPAGNTFARVSPGLGFWLLALAFALLAADALTRLRLGPWARLAAIAVAAGAIALLLLSGAWNDLSMLKEYANRADSFWREARQHLCAGLRLAGGGLPRRPAARHPLPPRPALADGDPAGAQHRPDDPEHRALRHPDRAARLSRHACAAALRPSASAASARRPPSSRFFSIRCCRSSPTRSVGLSQVPPRGHRRRARHGHDRRASACGRSSCRWRFPVILTGIRIVLVQNIGLATMAALIGGGGFGIFVFQGIGQTAIDLVLLGAVPTVALSFVAAIVLDAIIDLTPAGRPMIEIEHLTKRYGETVVVDDVSFRSRRARSRSSSARPARASRPCCA